MPADKTDVSCLARTSEYALTERREVCNGTNTVKLTAVDVRACTMGFGPFGSKCITEVESADTMRIWRQLAVFDKSLQAESKRISEIAAPSWTGAHAFSLFRHDDALTRCKLRHMAACRRHGVWALFDALTMPAPSNITRDWSRFYLEEYLTKTRLGRWAICACTSSRLVAEESDKHDD